MRAADFWNSHVYYTIFKIVGRHAGSISTVGRGGGSKGGIVGGEEA